MRVHSIYYQPRTEEGAGDVPAAPPALLSADDAAMYVGMSSGWLKKSRTKRLAGKCDAPPFVKLGVRRVAHRRKDLDEWIDSHVQYVSRRIDERVGAKLEAEAEAERRRNPVL